MTAEQTARLHEMYQNLNLIGQLLCCFIGFSLGSIFQLWRHSHYYTTFVMDHQHVIDDAEQARVKYIALCQVKLEELQKDMAQAELDRRVLEAEKKIVDERLEHAKRMVQERSQTTQA